MDNQTQPPQATQGQTPQAGQPDYAHMTEQQRIDAAMKQAGFDQKSMKKQMVKTAAVGMGLSMLTSLGHRLIGRLFRK